MNSKKSNNQNRKENRGNSGKNSRRRNLRPSFFRPTLECCICNKHIKEVTSAIAHGENREPAHFECVMKQLKENEKLLDGERLVYIGSGSFAVIKTPSGGGRKKFEIVRKLDIEERDKKPEEWRRKMRTRVVETPQEKS